jgi:energy-coupling factor transporter ATP-binding protein EcfA2
LYVGYPFIEGKSDEVYIKAPILLFPVDLEIDRKKQEITLVPQHDMEISLNKTLIFAINKYFGKKIDDRIQDEIEDVLYSKRKLNEKIEIIINILSNYINISKYNNKNNILERFSKEKINEINIFYLRKFVILGIFTQFSNAIANDYEELIKAGDLGLIDYLLGENGDYEFEDINIDKISENEKYFVSDIDPSQEESILSFKYSNSKGIVIHGPPGTGKSQTIVNLIAQLVKENKRVLIVCQKKTALDVVKNRLEAYGINNVVLVEDYNRDRNIALRKMEDIIGKISTTFSYEWDRITEINEKIDEKIEVLNSLKDILERKWECGLSLYELYIKNKDKDTIKSHELRNVLTNLEYKKLKELLEKLEKISEYYIYDENILRIRKSWKDLMYSDVDEIRECVSTLIELNKLAAEYSDIPYSMEELAEHLDLFDEFVKLLRDGVKIVPLNTTEAEILKNKLNYIRHKIKTFQNDFSVSFDELSKSIEHLKSYMEFSKKPRPLKFIEKLYNSNIKKSEEIVKYLEKKTNCSFDELYYLYILFAGLNESFLKDYPKELTKRTIDTWISNKLKQIYLLEIYNKIKSKFNIDDLGNGGTTVEEHIIRLKSYGALYLKYVETLEKVSKYFNP